MPAHGQPELQPIHARAGDARSAIILAARWARPMASTVAGYLGLVLGHEAVATFSDDNHNDRIEENRIVGVL